MSGHLRRQYLHTLSIEQIEGHNLIFREYACLDGGSLFMQTLL